jgi:proteasome lid subunit RPN8/RPN11
MPVVAMAWAAYEDILRCIASRPAETGGILLGPVGSAAITRFHFDQAGSCTACSYSPDYVGLSRRMKQEWLPSGIDMKGFVHSHPGRLDWLTAGDLHYVRRLLLANDDMNVFVAPIVIPVEFRIRPIVVLRTDMNTPRQARLALY